jgi:hypothetical protein
LLSAVDWAAHTSAPLSNPSVDWSSSAPNTFLSVFELVLPSEICEIVDKCPAKSSFADPVPTNNLKKIIHVLAKPFASLINLSLSSGVFPDSMKLPRLPPITTAEESFFELGGAF